MGILFSMIRSLASAAFHRRLSFPCNRRLLSSSPQTVLLEDERLFVYGFRGSDGNEEHYLSFMDSDIVAKHGLWTEAIIGKVATVDTSDSGAEIDLSLFQRNRAFRELMVRCVADNVSDHPALISAAEEALADGATPETCIIPFVDQRSDANSDGQFKLEDLVGYVKVLQAGNGGDVRTKLQFEPNATHNILTVNGVTDLGGFLHDKLLESTCERRK